jgi:hypothetical protein
VPFHFIARHIFCDLVGNSLAMFRCGFVIDAINTGRIAQRVAIYKLKKYRGILAKSHRRHTFHGTTFFDPI